MVSTQFYSTGNVELESTYFSDEYRGFLGDYAAILVYPKSSITSEIVTASVTVTDILGASYNFEQSAALIWGDTPLAATPAEYKSTNEGVDSSYSICRVTVTCSADVTATINWKSGGESNYDYGIIGQLNTALGLSSTADTTYTATTKGSGSTSSSASDYYVDGTTTITIPSGGAWFDIKYIKDSSNSYGSDMFAFAVRID